MAISKAELRTLALPGIREKINWHRSEISRLLEEAPELMTKPEVDHRTANNRDPSRPKITDQALEILSTASKPMKAGEVFRAIQALPNPSTQNDTSVYASLTAAVTNTGLASRSDDGFRITAKGRKHLESLASTHQTATGGKE